MHSIHFSNILFFRVWTFSLFINWLIGGFFRVAKIQRIVIVFASASVDRSHAISCNSLQTWNKYIPLFIGLNSGLKTPHSHWTMKPASYEICTTGTQWSKNIQQRRRHANRCLRNCVWDEDVDDLERSIPKTHTTPTSSIPNATAHIITNHYYSIRENECSKQTHNLWE